MPQPNNREEAIHICERRENSDAAARVIIGTGAGLVGGTLQSAIAGGAIMHGYNRAFGHSNVNRCVERYGYERPYKSSGCTIL